MRRLVLPAGSLGAGPGPGLGLTLPEELARYVQKVLRLELGAELAVGDGAGLRAVGRIVRSDRRGVELALGPVEAAEPPRPPHVVLVQAIGKGDKLDAVVRQATELGVDRIVPVLTERAVARHEARVERWRAIAEDAVRVSGRSRRPAIEPVVALEDLLARPRAPAAVVLAPDAGLRLRDAALSLGGEVEVLIGPEGGLAPEELTEAGQAGFTPVGLGPEVLRTETAGPAAVALLRFLGGALG